MRDVLVVLVFSVGVVMALKRPYYGALLWVWIGLMNPHRLTWGFAYSLPLAQIAAIATFLGMIFRTKELRWPGGGPLYALVLLTLWMGVTTLNAILLDASLERYIELLKVIVMTLVIATIVRTREEIIGLLWTIAASIGFYGIKGGIFTLASGGSHRVWGPPDSVVNGNNEIAVALVIIFPLLYFLFQTAGAGFHGFLGAKGWAKRARAGLAVAMVLCAVAALGSQSRGALLAIGAMLAVLWWRSEKKWPLTVMLMLLVPVVLVMLPETWYARMETIRAYDQDASALGRLNAWRMAFNIAMDRLTGAGFATAAPLIYQQYAPNPDVVLVAHSIYFQVLGEHGFVGLLLYLSMWLMTHMSAGRVVKLAGNVKGLEWASSLASMLKVSFVGFFVGGAFLSLAYWDMPLYLLVVVVAVHALVREKVASDRNRGAREAKAAFK